MLVGEINLVTASPSFSLPRPLRQMSCFQISFRDRPGKDTWNWWSNLRTILSQKRDQIAPRFDRAAALKMLMPPTNRATTSRIGKSATGDKLDERSMN